MIRFRDHEGRSMSTLIGYFALAYAISWAIWAPLWLPVLGVAMPPVLSMPILHALGSFGPALAALVVTGADEGVPGIKRLLHRLVSIARQKRLALVALFGPFVLLAIALVLQPALAGSSADFAALLVNPGFPGVTGVFLFLLYLVTFGLGEEMGWRGYALPQLENRWSPFLATLALTAGWALWHWPLFLYWPGFTGLGLGGAIGWLVSLWFGAMILTWLHDKTGGSLLVVVLFHTAINTVFANANPADFAPMAVGVMVTLIGIAAAVALLLRPNPASADILKARPER